MNLSGGTGDLRGPDRAALPRGLRSRAMAPVYALIVSFLTVLLLGAVVREPGTPAPAPTPTPSSAPTPTSAPVTIRLISAGGDVAELADVRAKVFTGTGRDVEVGRNGEFTVDTASTSLTICVDLPDRWSAPDANTDLLPGFTCWERVGTTARSVDPQPIELRVTKSGG